MHLHHHSLHVAQVGAEAALPVSTLLPVVRVLGAAHTRHDLLQCMALHLPELGRGAIARVPARAWRGGRRGGEGRGGVKGGCAAICTKGREG